MAQAAKAKQNPTKIDFRTFVESLESRILTGGFKPRERLIEASLSNMFGVSRYWVRDAFKILETKGLVTIMPYKGVVVNELNAKELEEIFVVRVSLEALAWRLAMENITEKDIAELRKLAREIEEAHKRTDIQAVLNADSKFHEKILMLARNDTLLRLISDLRKRCHIIRFSAWSSPEVVRQVTQEHYQFLEAVINKDIKTINQLAGQHISHAKKFYLFLLNAENAASSLSPRLG